MIRQLFVFAYKTYVEKIVALSLIPYSGHIQLRWYAKKKNYFAKDS